MRVPNGLYPPFFSSSVVAIHFSVDLSNLTMDRLVLLVPNAVDEGVVNAPTTVHDTERRTTMIAFMVIEFIFTLIKVATLMEVRKETWR